MQPRKHSLGQSLGGSAALCLARAEPSRRARALSTEAVSSDEETQAYVEELEQRAELLEDEEDLPAGESLAAELTRFLRERERGNGGPDRGPSEQP